MIEARKVKSLHCITIDGCTISTRLSYNSSTDHMGVNTSPVHSSKEYQKQYYRDNRHRGKLYREENSEAIAAYNKQYYEDNRGRVKLYYEANREMISIQKKRYYETNREMIAARTKQYQRDHPKEARTYVDPTGSCTKLKDWFEGCHRHHIDRGTIIHIPTEMHVANHHNIRTGIGMGAINALAFEFLFSVTI